MSALMAGFSQGFCKLEMFATKATAILVQIYEEHIRIMFKTNCRWCHHHSCIFRSGDQTDRYESGATQTLFKEIVSGVNCKKGIKVGVWYRHGVTDDVWRPLPKTAGSLGGIGSPPMGSGQGPGRGPGSEAPWKLLTFCHFWGLKLAYDPLVSLPSYVIGPNATV